MEVDESIPDSLYGDVYRVRQVIINLVSNAVKYTEHGSVRMTVRSLEDKSLELVNYDLLPDESDNG